MQSDEALLTVVIATKNDAPWIYEALQSILCQELPGIEIVVVDAGSGDRTATIVQELSESDNRVRLLRREGLSTGAARNVGCDAAGGQYLSFAGARDLVPGRAYGVLVASLQSSGSDLAVGDYLSFTPTATSLPLAALGGQSEPVRPLRLWEHPGLLRDREPWNKVFRRSFWLSKGFEFSDSDADSHIVPITAAFVAADAIDLVDDITYLVRVRLAPATRIASEKARLTFENYLRREVECAQLVATTDNAALTQMYASMVYELAGFAHTVEYLRALDTTVDGDEAVTDLSRSLLQGLDDSSYSSDVCKRATLELVARGELIAAGAVARVSAFGGDQDIGIGEVRAWATLVAVATAPEFREILADERITSRVIRTLRTASLESAEETTAWVTLARQVAEAMPEVAAAVRDVQSPERSAVLRRAARLEVTGVRGGRSLRVSGTAGIAPQMLPVLSMADGTQVSPEHWAWFEEPAGLFTWQAVFSLRAMPRYLSGVISFKHADGTFVSTTTTVPAPRYRAFDSLLYHQTGLETIYVRRAGWLVRAGRRVYTQVRGAVRRALRG